MTRLDDATINGVIVGIALDKNISTDLVRDIIQEHYKGIVHLIESGKPYQIKIDYFGKIEAKKTFVEIEKKIMLKFDSLTPRTYEVIQTK